MYKLLYQSIPTLIGIADVSLLSGDTVKFGYCLPDGKFHPHGEATIQAPGEMGYKILKPSANYPNIGYLTKTDFVVRERVFIYDTEAIKKREAHDEESQA